MLRLVLIMVVALVFETIGVVYMSFGLKKLQGPARYTPGEILRLVGRVLSNPGIVFGTLFQALFFFALLYLLSQGDVSFIWPLTALSYVFTTIAARYWLKEDISRLRWAGVVLIMIGAGLITLSEAEKKDTPKPELAVSRANQS